MHIQPSILNLQTVCIISPLGEKYIVEAEGCSLNPLDLSKVTLGFEWKAFSFLFTTIFLGGPESRRKTLRLALGSMEPHSS